MKKTQYCVRSWIKEVGNTSDSLPSPESRLHAGHELNQTVDPVTFDFALQRVRREILRQRPLRLRGLPSCLARACMTSHKTSLILTKLFLTYSSSWLPPFFFSKAHPVWFQWERYRRTTAPTVCNLRRRWWSSDWQHQSSNYSNKPGYRRECASLLF